MSLSSSIASKLVVKNPFLLHLKSCQSVYHLKQIHAQIFKCGFQQYSPAINELLARLALSEIPNMGYALLVFDQIELPSVFSWNTVIRGYSKAQRPKDALLFFTRMLPVGVKPNAQSLSFVANACGDLGDVRFLMAIHCQGWGFGFHTDLFLSNSIVRGYASCKAVDLARKLFEEMPKRDIVLWTIVTSGYCRCGRADEAIGLYFKMKREGLAPDNVMAVSLFNACSQLGVLNLARKLESLVYRDLGAFNAYTVNSLIDMYIKCGLISKAWELFDEMPGRNVVSWNTIIAGYAKNGDMSTACLLFDQMTERNSISWSSMISGYAQNGHFKEALVMYRKMQKEGFEANDATLVSTISACAHLGSLELGKEIHSSLDDGKLQNDVCLSTALVDMYARCGLLESALTLFTQIKGKNLISWNTMIFGYAMHGKVSNCIGFFDDLQRDGLRPDSVTFTGLLSGCVHAGWLDQGRRYFNIMSKVYGISPSREHFALVVDLFGRAGRLEESLDFIMLLNMKPDVVVWGALLNACKVHRNVELGEFAASRLLEIDSKHGAAHVLLSHIYAEASKWEDVTEVRMKMKETKIENRKGCSLIELKGVIHEFVSGDCSHPDMSEIFSSLARLHASLRISSVSFAVT